MPKTNSGGGGTGGDEIRNAAELERELRASMLSAFGSLFDIGDRVDVQCHSGAQFVGVVEDSNLAGLMVRLDQSEKLRFVSFAGIESAGVDEEESDDDGEGDAVDETETEEAAPEKGAPVTPIATRAA